MLGGGAVCPNNEFLRILAYAVWNIPKERQAYLQHLPGEVAKGLNTVQEFAAYLSLLTEGWLNLTHLIVWAWDHRIARQSTPVLPSQPTSHDHDVRPTQSASKSIEIPSYIIQWCAKHNLNQEHQIILARLGFKVGNDLKALLTDEDWRAVEALPLEKRRLIEASEKDKELSGATQC
jgi:hypothetical protein